MPWHELVIKGEEEDIEAFLAQTSDIAVLRGEEIAPVSFLDHLRDLLDLPHHHLLFAAPEGADELVRRVADHPRLQLKQRVAVERAGFRFEAAAFSEEPAVRIKAVIHAPMPNGVSLMGLKEGESRDAEANGLELYSPAHDYEYRASGRMEGDLGGVVEVHRRMRDIDFVDAGKIELGVREIGA